MEFLAREVTSADKINWNKFVEKSNGLIFHRWEWIELLVKSYNIMQNKSLIIFDSDENIVALLPLIVIEKVGFGKGFSIPFNVGGILMNDKREVWPVINNYLRKIVDVIQITSYDLYDYLEPKTMHNIVIDLQADEETILKSYSKPHRYDIRKFKDEIQLMEVNNCQVVIELAKIYDETMKQLKSAGTYSILLLENILSLPERFRRITVAIHNEKIIAFNICLIHEKWAHYFANASLYDYRRFAPNYKLLWDDILWAKRNGAQYVDLGGNVDGEIIGSLYNYKKKWGNPSNYYFYQKNYNLKGKMIKSIQNILKSRAGFYLKKHINFSIE